MIDINDYKIIYCRKLKKLSQIWIFILFLIMIGIIFINKNFKYIEYYQNRGEFKDNYLNLYVLIDDIDKITRNTEIYINGKKFAYKINSISEENLYLNNNYYKEIKLIIKDNNIIKNDIVDLKITLKSSSLLEYVFKTVWR